MTLRLLLFCGIIGAASATFCVPNTNVPKTKFEHACQVQPYRTFYAGGRCFIAVTSPTQLDQPCAQVFIKEDLGTAATLATIDSRDLLVALKQSSVFNPRTSYRVLSNIDGTNVFMSSSQFSRNYNYLCESRGKERCPEGFEMWNGKCYRFFSEKQGFEEAAETCAQISAYSTLASAEDETTNRFLSIYARSFDETNQDEGTAVWLGVTFVEDGYWADTKALESSESVSYYRWLATQNGMYTQSTNHPPPRSNAVFMRTTTSNSDGTAWFGYWGTANGGNRKYSFFCEADLIHGAAFVQAIVPIKPASNNNPPVVNVPFGSPQVPFGSPQVPFGSPQVPLGPPLYDDPFPSLPAFKRPKTLPVVNYEYPDEDGDDDNALDNKLCDRINGMLKQLIEPIGILQWELKSFLGSGTGNAIDSCRKTFMNLDDWGAKCVALEEQSIGAKAAC